MTTDATPTPTREELLAGLQEIRAHLKTYVHDDVLDLIKRVHVISRLPTEADALIDAMRFYEYILGRINNGERLLMTRDFEEIIFTAENVEKIPSNQSEASL